ncbi:MAG: YifB family Mg chelatase-like AAA ATPase [Frankiaceae bacterium]|jgi:magnesium chelatase family protein|nr:YifB family Mg chelatase-like AAA ATPase [Frankiaceae bacterium]
MSLARTRSIALSGIDGQLIDIEAHIANGLPIVTVIGLGDKSVSEARERIQAAVANSGLPWPNRRVTIALLPADLPKAGSRFDVAMALAVLAAAGAVPAEAVAGCVWVGELGLDGRLRATRGVLPAAVAARRAGVPMMIVPEANAAEAALLDGLEVRVAADLGQIARWLRREGDPPPLVAPAPGAAQCGGPDLRDVLGQAGARRALEIAAAGGHHLALSGVPGVGKTMLASRLPGLLPALDDQTALELAAVRSVAGSLPAGGGLSLRPPFEAPHHSASVASLVGGGSGLARPGAISRAHGGVLFLDEAPEFAMAALDALRQPLESGQVVLHRSAGAVAYPARFQLVLAANPCPCASASERGCTCSPMARRRYRQRLSGPLIDRIDLNVTVYPVPGAQLLGDSAGPAPESSAAVAARVAAARRAAERRWAQHGWRCNAEASGAVLRSAPWRPPRAALRLAETALERGLLSARGFDRVLRMAWSIADLAGRDSPGEDELAEAISYRTGALS